MNKTTVTVIVVVIIIITTTTTALLLLIITIKVALIQYLLDLEKNSRLNIREFGIEFKKREKLENLKHIITLLAKLKQLSAA